MAWGLWRRFSPLKKLRDYALGTDQREMQRRSDLYRLFLYTSLRERLLGGGAGAVGAGGGQQLAAFAEELAEQAKALPAAELEAAVQRSLRSQLAAAARALHEGLAAAGDAARAAAALERAAADRDREQEAGGGGAEGQSHAAGGGGGSGGGGLASLGASLGQGGGGGSGDGAARLLGQEEVAALLRQRLGYSVAVAPSTIQHEEAGLGLFLRGSCPPGSVVALFPGLVYSKADYRRMPGYPKVDKGNPYLVAAYTGHVVDSLPWGRGWRAPKLPDTPRSPGAAGVQAPAFLGAGSGGSSSSSRSRTTTTTTTTTTSNRDATPITSASSSASASSSSSHQPPEPPPKKGYVRLMVEASDGPRRAPPLTEWVRATSYEAASLELLEGRHPLALAQFANHATRSLPPNTMVAPLRFKLRRRGGGGGPAGEGAAAAEGAGEGALEGGGEEPAWLRAYVPFIPYTLEPGPGHLLDEEVVGMGLVALAPISDGEEVVFNYRLSPGLGRPPWYVALDEEEEDRRWATSSPAGAAAAAGAPPAAGAQPSAGAPPAAGAPAAGAQGAASEAPKKRVKQPRLESFFEPIGRQLQQPAAAGTQAASGAGASGAAALGAPGAAGTPAAAAPAAAAPAGADDTAPVVDTSAPQQSLQVPPADEMLVAAAQDQIIDAVHALHQGVFRAIDWRPLGLSEAEKTKVLQRMNAATRLRGQPLAAFAKVWYAPLRRACSEGRPNMARELLLAFLRPP